MKEFFYTWDIENVSHSWHKTGQKIVSPKFFAGPMLNSAWTLEFYPRGSENSDYFSLKLCREKDDVPIILAVNSEFSCILADASIHRSSIITQNLKNFEYDGHSNFEETCFMQRSEVFGRKKALYLPRDTLTLRCRMWQDDDTHVFGQCFGRTRFEIDRIIRVEQICHLVDKTFQMQTKVGDKEIMSLSVLYCHDKIDVKTNLINKVNMKFSTCKLTFLDKCTRRKLCEHVSCYLGNPQNEHWKLSLSDKIMPTENENSESDIEMITELVYSTGVGSETIECSPRESEFTLNYMSQNNCPTVSEALWNLYREQILCDVELKLPEKSFHAHRFLLCARSPVFLKKLTCDKKEERISCIEIEDISVEAMEIFLRFLYTDSVVNLTWNVVTELFNTSIKFDVKLLHFQCCSYFLKNVTIGNICELLTLADRRQDSRLKLRVNKILWKNEEIFGSPDWKKITDEQPKMAIETMCSKYYKENQGPAKTYDELVSSCDKIKDDLSCLYLDETDSDIWIKFSGDTIPTHKAVLCASSLTFRDILTKNSNEEPTDFYDMEDWDKNTVRTMLTFLYTGSLRCVQWDRAIKLYHLAVEFQIQLLKFKSACFLLENLKVSNAIDLLLLAHEHADIELKSTVEDFIHLHDDEIFGSDEWAKLIETNLSLALEIMRGKYNKNSNVEK